MNENQEVFPFGGDLEGAGAEGARHTEDMQEIITKVPSWLLRWGIMLFFGILLMVAAISVFVRFPDTIKVGMRFESAGVSVPVVAPVGGSVINVLVKQGAAVKTGQVLANLNSGVLIAPQDGEVGFVAIVEPGSVLRANEVVFFIHPQREQFFGVMEISAGNINKIKVGQQVLISLRNYPPNEYGRLKGRIAYIADEPGRDGLFAAKVKLENAGLKQLVALKSWMSADAEIITEDVSVLKRVTANLFKFMK